jgi:hypothetical protein
MASVDDLIVAVEAAALVLGRLMSAAAESDKIALLHGAAAIALAEDLRCRHTMMPAGRA